MDVESLTDCSMGRRRLTNLAIARLLTKNLLSNEY